MADIGHPANANLDRLCFSIPQTAKMLGVSRGLAYELARTGQLPIVRFVKRLLVPKAALEQMLAKVETPKDKLESIE